jgi:hypothetical protein
MNNIDVSRISFTDLKQAFVDFAKTNPNYTDWQFEGSNISFLIDMLTYATYYTNTYQSFALNETFLDTATQRANVVAKAKIHGYIPKSRRSANLPIQVNLDKAAVLADGVYLPDSLTFPKGTRFTVKILDTDFTFSTLRTYSIFNDAGVYKIDNMLCHEGIARTDIAYYSLNSKIQLPRNIDITTLSVTIDGTEWVYAESGIRYNEKSKIYYIQENSLGLFEIYFGDDVVSAQPTLNSKIELFYLESSGVAANAGVANFEIAYTDVLVIDRVDYTKYLSFTPLDKPGNAVERESTEDVRRNSSYAAVSQNRAVTVRDYVYVMDNIFYDTIIRSNAWDINDLDYSNQSAIELGKVTIVCQPRTFRVQPYLTQYDRNTILKTLSSDYILGGIRLNIIDPVYLKINHSIDIYYDESKLDIEISAIKQKIIANIRDLYDSSIINFENYLPVSRIQSVVDESDRSIVSSSVRPTVTIEEELEAGIDFSWSTALNLVLKPGSISSNFFTLRDVNGVIVSDFGNVGTVNYTTGEIVIDIDGVYVTADGTLQLTFETVDPFIKTTKEHLLIDGDENTYTWNFVKIQ